METEEKQQTIAEFIAKHGFKTECVRTDSNPNMENSRDMDHWRVTLKRKQGRVWEQMTIVFSMGFAHNGKQPGADDVLNCIALDSGALEMSFGDFCSEFGYDEDSRKAERTWEACKKQGEDFESAFGRELLIELQNCERL